MKKTLAITFTMLFSLILFACSSNKENTTKENEAPVISGVVSDVEIDLGQTINLLENVSATDTEDGNLTDEITITSIPELTVIDGEVTPNAVGSYYITYSVTDSDGETTKEYSTLKVNEVVGEPTVYIDYDFVSAETDMEGFEVAFESPAEGNYTAEKGVITIDVLNNGDFDWHAKLFKTGMSIESGATYTFTIRMKASETIYAHYIINNAEVGWNPYGGTWNMEIGTDYVNYSLEFLAETASSNAEFLLQFGGDTFDTNTNPEAFTLTVDYISIKKSVGSFTENAVITDNFDDGLTVGWLERGVESHNATISNVDNKLQFQIDSYPIDNNPWEMDLYRATEYDLVSGNTYKLSFDYTTINDQFYELCFEDPTMDWQIRAGFKDGKLSQSGTLEFTFIASMDITDLHIKLSLGKAEDGVTSNTIIIDNLVFYELTGDKVEETETIDFVPNEDDVFWGTYNNNNDGAYGVVYAEDDKLIYEIESFGSTDWYNKVYIENITLIGNGLYTMVFTAKADKEIQGLAGLNVMGQWDPRIWESITLTEEEQTFSFTMDAKLLFDLDFEMLFQFGFSTNEAPAKITFTDIKILRQE